MKFLPGRHLIDSFGNGGFRFGEMSHLGSIMVLPSGIRVSAALSLDEFSIDAHAILAEKSQIDFLLVGTGKNMLRLPQSLAKLFSEAGINVDTMNTNAAVRTYNVLLEEQRRVAALLIAVP